MKSLILLILLMCPLTAFALEFKKASVVHLRDNMSEVDYGWLVDRARMVPMNERVVDVLQTLDSRSSYICEVKNFKNGQSAGTQGSYVYAIRNCVRSTDRSSD